jgi:hypothetical protein
MLRSKTIHTVILGISIKDRVVAAQTERSHRETEQENHIYFIFTLFYIKMRLVPYALVYIYIRWLVSLTSILK